MTDPRSVVSPTLVERLPVDALEVDAANAAVRAAKGEEASK